MFFFRYRAKWAEKLPFWDAYPLIFVTDIYEDGWLGINLHYLPPHTRALLMDRLMVKTTNKNYDDTTKLVISYGILNEAKRLNAFRPCVKRYLADYVPSRTRIIEIPPKYWDMVMFLPTASWQKAPQDTVWAESLRVLRKHRHHHAI